MKIAALALSCALLGGAAGAGISAAINHSSGSGNSATVNVSGRTASQVTLKTVDGKTAMIIFARVVFPPPLGPVKTTSL